MSLSTLLQVLPPLYKVIFMVCMTIGIFRFAWGTWKNLKKDWIHLQRLHQIPCSRCDFFTGEYNLKCAVHPDKAFSEQAIGCMDFQPKK